MMYNIRMHGMAKEWEMSTMIVAKKDGKAKVQLGLQG